MSTNLVSLCSEYILILIYDQLNMQFIFGFIYDETSVHIVLIQSKAVNIFVWKILLMKENASSLVSNTDLLQ